MFEHTYTHTRTHTHLQQHLSHTLLGLHNTLTQTRTQTQTNTHTNSDASATLFSVYIVFGSQIGISNQVLMQCAVVNRWLALFMGFGWYFVGIFFSPLFLICSYFWEPNWHFKSSAHGISSPVLMHRAAVICWLALFL